MSTRDQKPILLDRFRGFYNREEPDQIPPDHLRTAFNISCGQKGFNGRDGFTTVFDASTFGGSRYSHMRTFQQVNAAANFLLLDSSTHNWCNSVEGLNRAAPVTATKLAAVMMFNRQYFSFSDGQTGLSGEKVQIYSPGTSWVTRQAAGVVPASACTAAIGAAGKVEIGTHVINIVYETDTGFITPPNTAAFVTLTTPGATKIDLTNVPIGPTGTAKRHVIISKRIANYSSNPLDYKMFFVPGGTIANNSGTTITIDFYDSALLSSADYLLDLMTSLPAGVALGEMNGRMLILAPYGSGWVVYASRFNDPESVSNVDGIILAKPGEGGNIKSYLVEGTTLYLFKDNRVVSVQDNGLEPSFWKVSNLDGALGTCLDGLSTSNFNGNSNTPGTTIVANFAGVFQFNGGFAPVPLTWKIEKTWGEIFNPNISITIDVVRRRIYVLAPVFNRTRGPATTNTLLMGDYSEGLDPQSIKWHIWGFDSVTDVPAQVFVYSDGNTILNTPAILLYNTTSLKTLVKIVDTFNSTAITVLVETADLSFTREECEIGHVQEIRPFGRFSGTTSPSTPDRTIAIAVKDSGLTSNTESKNYILSTTSPSVWAFASEYLQLKNCERFYLSISAIAKVYVGKIVVYGKQIYTSKPQ